MPRTAKAMGVSNAADPAHNIKGGIKYMDWLRDRFPQSLPISERLWFTLAAYNAGEGRIGQWLDAWGNVPTDEFVERIPFDAKSDDDPNWYILKVGHLFERKPDKFCWRTPSDAKLYAAQLQDAMRQLSAWLEDNAGLGSTLLFET